jgi:hypothetical protein
LLGLPTITDKDYFSKYGMNKESFLALDPTTRNFLIGLPVLTDKDYFKKFGLPKADFEALSQENRDILLGLPTITDKDYFTKFGMDKESFLALDQDVRNRLLDITPKTDIQKDAKGRLVDVTDPDNPRIIWDVETRSPPKLQIITIDGIPQTVDINSPEGMARVDLANKANLDQPGRASFYIVTDAPTPRGFVINNPDGTGEFVMSYNNGLTYTDKNGKIQPIPSNAYAVSDTIADDVAKGMRASNKAGRALEDLDAELAKQLGLKGNVTSEDITAVKSAFEMAREGTGFWSNIVALMDGAIGGIPFEGARDYLSKFTKDNQSARQYLRAVTVLGRAALVNNPRFPVAEMQKVEGLFVRPESFFENPTSAAYKFVELKGFAIDQYRRNLTMLRDGVPKDIRQQIEANNFELQRLMSLLPGTPLPGEVQGATDEAVREASSFLFPDS